jgi:hypothetical protein
MVLKFFACIVLSLLMQMVLKIFACIVLKKINMKFLLASLKTLTNSKKCSESRIKFLFWPYFALTGQFIQCTFIAGYHRRVSEQAEQIL